MKNNRKIETNQISNENTFRKLQSDLILIQDQMNKNSIIQSNIINRLDQTTQNIINKNNQIYTTLQNYVINKDNHNYKIDTILHLSTNNFDQNNKIYKKIDQNLSKYMDMETSLNKLYDNINKETKENDYSENSQINTNITKIISEFSFKIRDFKQRELLYR